MLLYFNGLFSFLYLILMASLMNWKVRRPAWRPARSLPLTRAWRAQWSEFKSMSTIFRIISLVVFIIWCVMEPLRLWFGVVGNLKEKVPQLAAFFLLNVFPQVPCLVFLGFVQPKRLPFERIASVVQLVLVALSALVGFVATRRLIRHQTEQFYLNRFASTTVASSTSQPVKFEAVEPMSPSSDRGGVVTSSLHQRRPVA